MDERPESEYEPPLEDHSGSTDEEPETPVAELTPERPGGPPAWAQTAAVRRSNE